MFAALAGMLTLTSCSSDDDKAPIGDYQSGMFILNEGGFMAGNASVTFAGNDGVTENGVFSAVNGRALGDTGQDIKLKGDLAYIVLNVSNKVEIVNRYTFESLATVTTGLDNPRYIAFSGNNAYVTNWGDPTDTTDDYVAVVSLSSNTVTTSIPVAEGPEKIVEANGELYVSHKGGYGFGNTITVINASANAVTATIPVGDVPNNMAVYNGSLFVMCEGMPSWSSSPSGGGIYVVGLSDNAVDNSFLFGFENPGNLTIENGVLYYTIDSGVYSMDANATVVPDAPVFTVNDQGVYGVYGMAVHDGKIYVADAGDYNSNGKVLVYALTGGSPQIIDTGVIPSGFAFN